MSERAKKPDADKTGGAPDAAQAAPRPSADPRHAKWQAIVKSATQYNTAHADLVAEFNKLTGGKCVGENAGVSVREVRKWQMEHGLQADGKIGKKTIDAAKKESKAQKPDGKDEGGDESISFGDNAAGDPEAPETAGGGDDLAESAVAGGEADGEEKREEKTEDPSKEGGGFVQESADKLGNDMAGEGQALGVGVAARLALVPHIVNLLRAHKFKEAVDYIKGSVKKSDLVEIVKAVTEKLAGELSDHALEIFKIAATAGLVYDVLKIGWEWTIGGIKAVQEAHEAGDRDARIGIYAWAWADCVLTGKHDNPGIVGEDQREAMSLGITDGLATRDQSPELPFLLMAEYGSEDNARKALQDALYKRAGISGIRTHHAGK